MKHYLKIENNAIKEAPKTIKRNGYTVYGYNSEDNAEMLIQDGYAEYPCSVYSYEIKDGKITLKKAEEPVVEEKTVFSKLEIRRACRALGIEDKLNMMIEYNDNFYRDWHDAQQIDLNDPFIQQAIEAQVFTQQQIDDIKGYLR